MTVERKTTTHGQGVSSTIATDAFGTTYLVMLQGRCMWRTRVSLLEGADAHLAAKRRLDATRRMLTEPSESYFGPGV